MAHAPPVVDQPKFNFTFFVASRVNSRRPC